MPDTKSAAGKVQKPEYDAGHVPMTEELDDLKHNLPNIAPMAIALVVIAVVVAAAAYLLRSKPVANGSIQNVAAVEQLSHTTKQLMHCQLRYNALNIFVLIKTTKKKKKP